MKFFPVHHIVLPIWGIWCTEKWTFCNKTLAPTRTIGMHKANNPLLTRRDCQPGSLPSASSQFWPVEGVGGAVNVRSGVDGGATPSSYRKNMWKERKRMLHLSALPPQIPLQPSRSVESQPVLSSTLLYSRLPPSYIV